MFHVYIIFHMLDYLFGKVYQNKWNECNVMIIIIICICICLETPDSMLWRTKRSDQGIEEEKRTWLHGRRSVLSVIPGPYARVLISDPPELTTTPVQTIGGIHQSLSDESYGSDSGLFVCFWGLTTPPTHLRLYGRLFPTSEKTICPYQASHF